MIATSRLALFSLLLALIPAASGAQTRFFLGAGPTGTSAFGFTGGWGGSIGFERRLATAGAFLLKVDGTALPNGPSYLTYAMPFSSPGLGESGGSAEATLLSVMAGLRLGGVGRLTPYLDALVGVGYLNDPANTAAYSAFAPSDPSSASGTNVALSFGPGVAVRAGSLPALFADVHYDFYFSRGADTPVIPVRVGLLIP